MRKIYFILGLIMLICVGCQWRLKANADESSSHVSHIQRFDRIESLYLSTGDFSALQQMNTYFPTQTRMLLEDVLRLGHVDDADINTKFLYFFQDSTLQHMLNTVQQQYAEMDDVDEELQTAFSRLQEELPDLELPDVYTQIGSFDQSIIVGTGTLGISLDKYLGSDYPFYQQHYSEGQRRLMVRSMIVPDCLSFFILSQYPLSRSLSKIQAERDRHMAKIQWVVNYLTGRTVFGHDRVMAIDEYMKKNPATTIAQLLEEK